MKHIVVVYHDKCIDGIASAWILHRKWDGRPETALRYIPYAHHEKTKSKDDIFSALHADAELYFVDVAPGKTALDEILSPDAVGDRKISAVHILDHHKSAAENLKGYKAEPFHPPLNIHIDETAPAAALLIWGKIFPDLPAPPFIEMIAKMDRGENMVSDDDFSAAAFIDSMETSSLETAFHAFAHLSGLSLEHMAQEGKPILETQKKRLRNLAGKRMFARICVSQQATPLRIPVVNADIKDFGRPITKYLQDAARESGGGIAAAWNVMGNGTVSLSFRTDGSKDVSVIVAYLCKKWGIAGGGHAASAALQFPSLQKFCEVVPLEAV